MQKPTGDNSQGKSDNVSMQSSLRGQIERTSEKKIEVPNNIIPSVSAARSLYNKFRQDSFKRVDLYARIEGLIAGNPPYDVAELRKSNLGHMSNFNTLDGRSLYERGAQAYWNLLNQAETLIKFIINDTNPVAREWEDILAKNWDRVVRHWPSFNSVVNLLIGQLLKLGLSPAFWPDERDWRWRVVEMSKFYIPDQTVTDVQQLTAVCIETTFTGQYLWEAYMAFADQPEKSPWNRKELEALLLNIANTNAKSNFEFTNVLELQQRIQNGDIGFDVIFTDSIRIISLLYQEYEGGISHYMFHRTFDEGEFLYFVDRQYKSWEEALVIFTASPGEYTLHSNRGLGHKLFTITQAMMQLDCSIVDMARWSATPLIQGLAQGSQDVEAIRFYPGAPLNLGSAQFVNNTLGANITQLINASQYLLQKVQFNTANSGDDPGVPDRSQGSISSTQAKMQSYREYGVLKNNISHFYYLFDIVLRTMVIKMLKSKKGYPGYEYVKAWKDACIRDGVDESIFDTSKLTPWGMPEHLDCKAARVAGDGSVLGRIMGLQELQPIMGTFGPREAKEYKRQYVMATMGIDYVPAFLQETDMADEQAGGASLAGLENNSMQQGLSPIFSLDNEHRSHLSTHIALGVQTMQNVSQQKTNPVEADRIFNILVPHLDSHAKAAAQSVFNQQFMGQVQNALGEIARYAALNRGNAEKILKSAQKQQQEAQANQQRVMAEEELKNMQVVNDEKRKDLKIQSQLQRADSANKVRADIMNKKVELDHEVQRRKVELEHGAKLKELDNNKVVELNKGIVSNVGALNESERNIS